mmetsp:Transcript_5558/g.10457  ORF Transcript_5558/g.10457 Transcript_5558/m.10457 type:complete len:84 (+) Transcript_5558:55-306(+)
MTNAFSFVHLRASSCLDLRFFSTCLEWSPRNESSSEGEEKEERRKREVSDGWDEKEERDDEEVDEEEREDEEKEDLMTQGKNS